MCGAKLRVSIILPWIVLAILALISLARRKMSNTARAIWALMIVIVPILGAAAYFIACCKGAGMGLRPACAGTQTGVEQRMKISIQD